MDTTVLAAALVGLFVAVAILIVWFGALWLKNTVVPWLTGKLLEDAQKQRSMGKTQKDGQPISVDPVAHRRAAWIMVSFTLFVSVGALALLFSGGTRRDQADERAAAERIAKGIYGATVIACYGMNDVELMLNQSRCKDALRRVRGY